MHYTDDQLCEFLDEAESDFSNSDLSHLETCEDCRQRLSSLAGAGEWLGELMDSVGDVTGDLSDESYASASSVVISVDSSNHANDRLQCDAVRLDFLDKPTHPELLGRLGRYDIERLIGMGGYGIVFKARDSELNRIVAIKVLAPHLMNSGPARQRFAREAQASAAVVHDHVVPIYDVVNDSEVCYFVMKYLSGQSLQERVDRNGPLGTEDVLQIAAQIASGLQEAHAQGLIHRDVKPGNILLEDNVNRVMISDFGLARASDDASLTRSGTITGTPQYMSPEQARGQSVDCRSDLFSLGSVIYFMCTGKSPFRAPQMMAVLNRICHEDPRPIEESNPQVPYELTKVVDRLLAKKPDERLDSAQDVHDELRKLQQDFQSGKLRPRRFVAPRVNVDLLKKVAAGVFISAVSIAVAMFIPRDRPIVEEATQSPSVSASSLAGLGTTRLDGASNSARNAVDALERKVWRHVGSQSSPQSWHREVSAIEQQLAALERLLGNEEPHTARGIPALTTDRTYRSGTDVEHVGELDEACEADCSDDASDGLDEKKENSGNADQKPINGDQSTKGESDE